MLTTISTAITSTQPLSTTSVEKQHSILVLRFRSDEAFLIDETGAVTTTEFEYGKRTKVAYTCGTTWRNTHYIFGGMKNAKQISKAQGHLYTSLLVCFFNFTRLNFC